MFRSKNIWTKLYSKNSNIIQFIVVDEFNKIIIVSLQQLRRFSVLGWGTYKNHLNEKNDMYKLKIK